MNKLKKVKEALEFYASCDDDCILIEMHRNEDINDILQIGKKAKGALAELNKLVEDGSIDEKLWQLLDDIDTAGDMFKPEITPYFNYVVKKAEERHKYLISDGFNLRR